MIPSSGVKLIKVRILKGLLAGKIKEYPKSMAKRLISQGAAEKIKSAPDSYNGNTSVS